MVRQILWKSVNICRRNYSEIKKKVSVFGQGVHFFYMHFIMKPIRNKVIIELTLIQLRWTVFA